MTRQFCFGTPYHALRVVCRCNLSFFRIDEPGNIFCKRRGCNRLSFSTNEAIFCPDTPVKWLLEFEEIPDEDICVEPGAIELVKNGDLLLV